MHNSHVCNTISKCLNVQNKCYFPSCLKQAWEKNVSGCQCQRCLPTCVLRHIKKWRMKNWKNSQRYNPQPVAQFNLFCKWEGCLERRKTHCAWRCVDFCSLRSNHLLPYIHCWSILPWLLHVVKSSQPPQCQWGCLLCLHSPRPFIQATEACK